MSKCLDKACSLCSFYKCWFSLLSHPSLPWEGCEPVLILLHMTSCLNQCPTPSSGQKVLALTWRRGNTESARWWLERAELGEAITAATLATPRWQGAISSVQGLVWPGCMHLPQISVSLMWATCNYPGSRLKCLTDSKVLLLRRAHFVSCDSSRALASVIKLQWWVEGQESHGVIGCPHVQASMG